MTGIRDFAAEGGDGQTGGDATVAALAPWLFVPVASAWRLRSSVHHQLSGGL